MIHLVYFLADGFPRSIDLFPTIHCPLITAKAWAAEHNARLYSVTVTTGTTKHVYHLEPQP